MRLTQGPGEILPANYRRMVLVGEQLSNYE